MRTLPSGRYQARYKVGGQPYTAPLTFETRRDAEAWLAATRTEVERGGWTSPDAARVPLREYARAWVTRARPAVAHRRAVRGPAAAARAAGAGRPRAG
ncbi:MAG: hypothetical protein U5R31_04750 [Acidimicrobiia bacterium]|nr:hypothetical protein [Acidimicrobiia bacterium]